MKNKQKGFISIAVIIWVIVGALIVGGATYVVVNQMSDNEGNAPKDRSSGQSAGISTEDGDDQPAEVNFDTSSTVQTEMNISPIPDHSAPDQDLIDKIQAEKAEGKQ